MTQKNNQPLVSVIIPAYNSSWCLEKALDSVLAQSFKEFELIVVNDGSTDNTAEVLSGYGHAIHVVNQNNGGLSNARNTGIKTATGKYVAFLDADDWWLPEKLEYQVRLLEERPDLGFCSTVARVENQDGELINIWSCPDIQGNILQTIFIQNAAIPGSGSAVMVRRELLDSSNLFDESLNSFEDIDLWLRLASITNYACINTPLAVIMKSDNSMSSNLDVMRDSALKSIIKNRGLLPKNLQGSFWRYCLAGVYTDYANWSLRTGQRSKAMGDIFMALVLSPLRRGRLCLGLIKDILMGHSV